MKAQDLCSPPSCIALLVTMVSKCVQMEPGFLHNACSTAAPPDLPIKDLSWQAGIKYFSLANLEILKPYYRDLPPAL